MNRVYGVGTCDTKGSELRYLRDLIRATGCDAVLVDVSVSEFHKEAADVDVQPSEVARFHPNLPKAEDLKDRGKAVAAMSEALVEFIRSRPDVDGIIGAGGTGADVAARPHVVDWPFRHRAGRGDRRHLLLEGRHPVRDRPTDRVADLAWQGLELSLHGDLDLVADGAEGLKAAASGRHDLVVLDLRLPGLSGQEVLRTLRDRGATVPVLVLTAQDSVDFKVQALRMGADDYVTKPFALEELIARVEALSRRPKALAPPVIQVADLTLDTGTRDVRRGGKAIELTAKEYAVLEYLMRHQGRVMSRTLITEYAWDYHFDPGTNIVDVVINRLRKKIDQGRQPRLIHTVRGVGYVLKA